MPLSDRTLEELLNEDESATLDFKRDAYPFVGASDSDKSELLKDILAFANAWRRSAAFILIGVDEVKGGRSKVVGISTPLNDADVQQFVNSKTNAPITFSYYTYPFEDTQIGVVEIARQGRPFFLTKNFGRLTKDTVYLRRGSSTDIADPSEIARMGAAEASSVVAAPSFTLEWANIRTQQALSHTTSINSLSLIPRLKPSHVNSSNQFGAAAILAASTLTLDPGYYSDAINYAYDAAFLERIGLVIRNTGDVVAENVVVKCRVERVPGVRIQDFGDRPIPPSKYRRFSPIVPSVRNALLREPDPLVSEYPSHWEISVDVQRIAPKATVWTTDVLWVGAEESLELPFPFEIFADTLAIPLRLDLTLAVHADARPMTRADLPKDGD